MTEWYGSLNNRLEENRQFVPEIKVGTGMTEYYWSDREPYEVIDVKDQRHVTVRKMDHKPAPGAEPMSNDWVLLSNPENPEKEMAKRGKYWYYVVTITDDLLDALNGDDPELRMRVGLFLAHNDVDPDKLREKKVIRKYHRANVSFGHAEYHYDYEF